MTRDEFIDGYMANSPICRDMPARRTPQGFEFGDLDLHDGFIALPCQCDYEGCHGWGMVPASFATVLLHCHTHLPDGIGPLMLNVRCNRCRATWTVRYADDLFDKLTHHKAPCRCPGCDTIDIFKLIVESYEQAAQQDAARPN